LSALGDTSAAVATSNGTVDVTLTASTRFVPYDRDAAIAGLRVGDYVAVYGTKKRVNRIVYATKQFTASA
jgi:hypothetical protein